MRGRSLVLKSVAGLVKVKVLLLCIPMISTLQVQLSTEVRRKCNGSLVSNFYHDLQEKTICLIQNVTKLLMLLTIPP